MITHFDSEDVPRWQCSRAGRTFYDYLNTHTHTHSPSTKHTRTHTHPAAAKAKGKRRGTTKGKANSSQLKQLLFKLDGVDFGNNNNKKINIYTRMCNNIVCMCVCVFEFVWDTLWYFVDCMRLAARQIEVAFLPASDLHNLRISIIKS